MAKTQNTPSTEPTPEETAVGKGRPTPSRAEREAARKQPLVPGDRRLAAKQDRAKQAEAREKARIGMAAGDERYLPVRDKGPQKRFARDWVDARFSVGEGLMVLCVLVILTAVIPPAVLPVSVTSYLLLGVWAYLIIAILDVVILGIRMTRKLREKYGDKTERIRFYVATRAFQLRPLRLPKPQVKRGQFPTL